MLKYLALTIAIEIPIYFLFDRNKIAYSTFVLILANCFTWPIVNILFHNTNIHLLILESGVTIVEAIIINIFLQDKFSKSLLISFIQNSITTFIGIWINNIQL
ncbi:MAG: hypothetical protein IT275_01055 [Chitinophagales bacterium]|nr:hypothetical protein [Chitinophagales bacterium]HNA38280.1 hypothetical protein [Chitinophagales bacterium]HND82016.1 hypothetical protein [Chitinophagales bacterium]HNF17737.1 hypothetical protein [Chitinophagales bacterium]HNG72422.1 hypothetical protein [Chitinophagales bacterium]